uniref:Uncharacterized protein n=1 Tax=Glossina palpalis gambiensis TaxID=67801 RepID=A0A1B0BAK4_9MUSC
FKSTVSLPVYCEKILLLYENELEILCYSYKFKLRALNKYFHDNVGSTRCRDNTTYSELPLIRQVTCDNLKSTSAVFHSTEFGLMKKRIKNIFCLSLQYLDYFSQQCNHSHLGARTLDLLHLPQQIYVAMKLPSDDFS